MKRILFILVFSLIFIIALKSDVIHSGTHGDNITWEITSDSVLTISGKGDMFSDDLDYRYCAWYYYGHLVRKIIINDGITSICSYAFLII